MGRTIRALQSWRDSMSEPSFRCAVLTISDRASRGEYEDKSGPALVAFLTNTLKSEVVQIACIPDEEDQIVEQLERMGQPIPND